MLMRVSFKTFGKILQYGGMGLVIFFIFYFLTDRPEPQSHPRDYAEIAAEGTIRATTEYNSLSYFVKGDTITGFHYELFNAFARDKGLKAEITPLMSFDERLRKLENGTFDVIAYGILATSELKDSLLLTTPILLNKQVLVQRKASKEDSLYINSQIDLGGRTLHVVKGSPSILRIRNLSNEIGDTIYIQEVEKYGSEQLIALVAHGDIDYAVCDESIAREAVKTIPNIDINTGISFSQFNSWGVSKQSPALCDTINAWLERFRQQKEFQMLYQKYYGER